MNLTYFKDQLHEELNGAKDYIDKAIEAKIHHPIWSRTFVSMADAEISHATNLMKMMEECIKEKTPSETMSTSMEMSTGTPESIYKDCMKAYGEMMTYVTNMKRGL